MCAERSIIYLKTLMLMSNVVVFSYLNTYLYLDDDSSLEMSWEYGVASIISKVLLSLFNGIGAAGNCLSMIILICEKLPTTTAFIHMIFLKRVIHFLS